MFYQYSLFLTLRKDSHENKMTIIKIWGTFICAGVFKCVIRVNCDHSMGSLMRGAF